MENKSDTTCDFSTDIVPQIVVHRPNSKPDISADISRTESPILLLTQHYVLTNATNDWDGQNYMTYSTKGARLRSFIIHDWPHVLEPAPSALSDTGFFYR